MYFPPLKCIQSPPTPTAAIEVIYLYVYATFQKKNPRICPSVCFHLSSSSSMIPVESISTVGPLHVKHQAVNFQRGQRVFHQHQAWMKLQLALHLLLLKILQLCHLWPRLPPPVSNSSCLHSMPASVCQLLYCTTIPFKVPYCKIKNVFFIVCVF